MYYEFATRQKYIKAQLKLANFYENGLGVEKNYENAFNIYKFLAEQGNLEGQKNLARCYKYGLGIEQDIFEANKWFKLARSNH